MTFRRLLIILVILIVAATAMAIILQRMSGNIPITKDARKSANLPLATPPGTAVQPIRIIELCSPTTRTIDPHITISSNVLKIQSPCVNDRTGTSSDEVITQPYNTNIEDVSLQSVYASKMKSALNIEVSPITSVLELGISQGVITNIKRSDGKPCVVITATSRVSEPIPRRFTSTPSDWTPTIDYLIDKNCSVVAVQIGNHLAVMPTLGMDTFKLYDVSFSKSETLPILSTVPANILGEYAGIGCLPNDDACVPTQSSDSVKITRGSDDQMRADIYIHFPGQLCGIEDNISWTGDQFILKAKGIDDASPCELSLKVKDSILTIEDPGLRCREMYCGTHGTFNGTRFKHQ